MLDYPTTPWEGFSSSSAKVLLALIAARLTIDEAATDSAAKNCSDYECAILECKGLFDGKQHGPTPPEKSTYNFVDGKGDRTYIFT